MSSTWVMIGPICARRANRRSIHLNLSALFPIDHSHTSVGVQSLTSTAEPGLLTTVSLSHLQTPSSQTSQRFDQAGGLAYETRIENLRQGSMRYPSASEHVVLVRVTVGTAHHSIAEIKFDNAQFSNVGHRSPLPSTHSGH
jgi:hypothetical protein